MHITNFAWVMIGIMTLLLPFAVFNMIYLIKKEKINNCAKNNEWDELRRRVEEAANSFVFPKDRPTIYLMAGVSYFLKNEIDTALSLLNKVKGEVFLSAKNFWIFCIWAKQKDHDKAKEYLDLILSDENPSEIERREVATAYFDYRFNESSESYAKLMTLKQETKKYYIEIFLTQVEEESV